MSLIKQPRYFNLEQLQEAGKIVAGTIDELQVTGGEPTVHPQFGEISQHIREWFQPNKLGLCTNAVYAEKWKDYFKYYDNIQCTHYAEPYSRDNTQQMNYLRSIYPGAGKGEFILLDRTMKPSPHLPRKTRIGKSICEKGIVGPVSYWPSGLIYPCCVGEGVGPHVQGIPLTRNWVEEVERVPRGCEDCFFAYSQPWHP